MRPLIALEGSVVALFGGGRGILVGLAVAALFFVAILMVRPSWVIAAWLALWAVTTASVIARLVHARGWRGVLDPARLLERRRPSSRTLRGMAPVGWSMAGWVAALFAAPSGGSG